MSRPKLPWSIEENPLLCQWVDFSEPGIARVFSAKVEIGQGIVTAIAQIAAEELKLPMSKVLVVSGDTRCCPNENYTAGSMSIEIGGTSVRMACAEARHAIVERAARMLDADESRVAADGGLILLDGAPAGLDYWQVAREVDWKRPITGTAPFTAPESSTFLGKSVARLDLPAKVAGPAFIHDLELPGLLHGRVLRPPSYGARLRSLDQSAVEHLPGVVKIWRNGDFVGVCCEREYQAVRALEALRAGARWIESEVSSGTRSWRELLPTLRSIDSESEAGERPAGAANVRRLSATYSRPPIAHASMAPSCAVAVYDEGRLTVWTHSQGVFPLRGALASAIGLDESHIAVIHVQGAGVYGHNGADDVALDAVLLARQVPSRPVRIQWNREDELAWSPLGSPMVVKIEGAVSAAGDIIDWSSEIWSGPHGQRPRARGPVNLLAAAHVDPPIPFPEAYEVLSGFAGGARNSEPGYDLPHRKIVLHSLPGLPFRTSALRTLGGYANVFATESFMDELADAAGADPVEFRLHHLSDPRARRVIETAVRLADWQFNAERGRGRAAGIGFARYKNTAAYVAVIANVEVREDVRVSKVVGAVDAGLVINPDGVVNQIEGGIVQSISWTLKEQVVFDGRRVTTRTWEDYPILRFDEVPELVVDLIERPDCSPLGVGEAAQGPAAAAVANAVARALDLRIRDLPITRERIVAASAAAPA
ncbi:MAG TPA: molybdopterin cofactor-binding domain-containing protein [Candidatus Binataceae bacterium]|nr:molybdopterin cofactor-binding domain-containing protein [Candidatus Binataceae bacterium]